MDAPLRLAREGEAKDREEMSALITDPEGASTSLKALGHHKKNIENRRYSRRPLTDAEVTNSGRRGKEGLQLKSTSSARARECASSSGIRKKRSVLDHDFQ